MFFATRSLALRQTQYLPHTCFRKVNGRSITSRNLLSTFAVLEKREGKLNPSSLAAVSAAQRLGGTVTGFIAGSGVRAVAEEAAKVKGLEKVIYVDNSAYDKASLRNLVLKDKPVG